MGASCTPCVGLATASTSRLQPPSPGQCLCHHCVHSLQSMITCHLVWHCTTALQIPSSHSLPTYSTGTAERVKPDWQHHNVRRFLSLSAGRYLYRHNGILGRARNFSYVMT